MVVLFLVLLGFGVLTAVVWRYVQSLSGDQKMAIKDAINGVFVHAEARGLFPAAPAYDHDYQSGYPDLQTLEENYEVIRKECENLLGIKDKMTDMATLGGGYTAGDIHTVQWKTFMFKSGKFIEENCRLAPQTADLLRGIPNLYTAIFSVLDPHQHIAPHFGYYKGFLRYQLGVMIPNDNRDRSCYLRVNTHAEDKALRERSLIDKGEVYYWKNGEGVMFDDTFLHDAHNDSDEVRVVLFLDVARKLPWYLHAFNKLVLFVLHKEASVKRIRSGARLNV